MSLDSLAPSEVHRIASESLGAAPPSELVRALVAATAGLPFLVYAAVEAVSRPDGEPPAEAISSATRVALIERLRRVDEPVLDTLLLSSLSQDLGPDDVGGALGADQEQSQRLVDVARASGLIAPSHSPAFAAALHQSLAQILGAARHHHVEISLLRSQIDKSTLSIGPGAASRRARPSRPRAGRRTHGLRGPQPGSPREGCAAVPRRHRGRGQRAQRQPGRRAGPDRGLRDGRPPRRRAAGVRDRPRRRAAAVRIAASVAMHDGSAAQAAELFRWLGPQPDAVVGSAGVLVALGVGDVASARAALERRRLRAADVDGARGARSRRGTAADARRRLPGGDRPAGPVDVGTCRPPSSPPTPPPHW